MNIKRILALLLCSVMLLTMIPVVTLTVGAAEIEGDWTTLGDPDEEEEEDEDEEPGTPLPGYEYTADGCTIIQPDYTNCTPYFTIRTKDKQALKDGIYLQFRVDDYSWAGPNNNADQWICITLNEKASIGPADLECGGNWLSLIRGGDNGIAYAQPHITEGKTEEFPGKFTNHGGNNQIEMPADEEGRKIVTFELTWDGSKYEMKINGVVMPGADQATENLEKIDANGDFYIGITMHTLVQNGTAGLTILKYGTSEADATTPVGSDSLEPEPNEKIVAEIADPSTVEANKPAILWDPTTRKIEDGNNCSFTVLGDNTWRVSCSDAAVYYTLNVKNSWSYAAEDFPVFGVLYRNMAGGESGTIYYAAGEITGPTGGYMSSFSIYEGEFYTDAEGNEYIFVPFDMTDMWEGRINSIRVDVDMDDPENREFDICFAGMFRSTEEAFTYAEEYLSARGAAAETEAPETEAPETEAPETNAAVDTNSAETNATVDTGVSETTGAAGGEGGCASVVGFGAVAVLAAAAAFVALKKKD